MYYSPLLSGYVRRLTSNEKSSLIRIRKRITDIHYVEMEANNTALHTCSVFNFSIPMKTSV
jgi:hypothetical protein